MELALVMDKKENMEKFKDNIEKLVSFLLTTSVGYPQ